MISDNAGVVVGLSGHVGGAMRGSSARTIEELREALTKVLGCPINKGQKTIMLDSTFRRMCRKHQEISGIRPDGSVKKSKHRHTEISGPHFRQLSTELCAACSAGKSVRGGRRVFKYPDGITIDSSIKARYLAEKLASHRKG